MITLLRAAISRWRSSRNSRTSGTADTRDANWAICGVRDQLGNILAVQVDALHIEQVTQLQPDLRQHGNNLLPIHRVITFAADREADGAVQRPGIYVEEPERLGGRAGDGALARAGRAVNRNRNTIIENSPYTNSVFRLSFIFCSRQAS